MDPNRWNQIDSLLQSALAQPTGGRDAYLRQACADDPALEREVRSLLAARQEAESFLESPAIEVAAQALASPRSGEILEGAPRPLPSAIGRYRIVGLLGEGGMGVVYEADQEIRTAGWH